MGFKRKDALENTYNFTNIKHLNVENTEMQVCMCLCMFLWEVGRIDMSTNSCDILIYAIMYGYTEHSGNTRRLDIGGLI